MDRLIVMAACLLPACAAISAAEPPSEAGRERLESEADKLTEEGISLFRSGEAAEAVRSFEKALDLRRQAHGDGDHPSVAKSLNNLGLSRQQLGDHPGSMDAFTEALAMYRRVLDGKDDAGLANVLTNLAFQLQAGGKPREALPHLEEALAMKQRLYGDGDHAETAQTLHTLAVVTSRAGDLAAAVEWSERSLGMYRRLLGEKDHPALAMSLNNNAMIHREAGAYSLSASRLAEAVAMQRRLAGGGDRPDLAMALANLGTTRQLAGDYAAALPPFEESLAMYRRLYPAETSPQGHPDVAAALYKLGTLWSARGDHVRALPCYEEALAVQRRLHDGDHRDVTFTLNNIGFTLVETGRPAEALAYFEQALAMNRRLAGGEPGPDVARAAANLSYARGRAGDADGATAAIEEAAAMYEGLAPGGRPADPDHATALANLAAMRVAAGRYDDARRPIERSLAWRRELFPSESHPDLAASLRLAGLLHLRTGDPGRAVAHLRESAAVSRRAVRALALASSEAESLTFAASTSGAADLILTAHRSLPGRDAEAYADVWDAKAALTRILQQRAEAARVAAADSDRARADWDRLRDARRELSRLLLTAPPNPEERDQAVRQQTEVKERLERELAATLSADFGGDAVEYTPGRLADALPEASAFVDVIRYADSSDPDRSVVRYCAFVLTPGSAAVRVELGEAGPIEDALERWHAGIQSGDSGDAGGHLRRSVWEPIARHLPERTRTVYVSPDGELGRLPFAALPGEEGSALLERYAFAQVMHGPALARGLAEQPADPARPGRLLTVGGVSYGGGHPELPATAREQRQILGVAGDRPATALSGPDATADAVAEGLREARVAHLATHGFFAAELFGRDRARLDATLEGWELRPGQVSGQAGMGVRNPLGYVGLVFAAPEGSADPGILTGEAIVGLDLSKMELAVLSACETGLGERTGGEGVYGLQRAFHLAGCDNVVCSLWQVDDEATAALMAKLYHELWANGKPPIEALREAQLAIYRHPERIPTLARSRGFELDEAAGLPAEPPADEGRTTHPKLWAAFVLSGVGR